MGLGFVLPITMQKSTHPSVSIYPNELPEFKFYDNAKWKVLRPLESSISDVRRILGDPSESTDLSHYLDPYPGDDRAEAPVFTYQMNPRWEILVYFVKDCGYRFGPSDISGDRLCTIELIPKKSLSFRKVAFSPVFAKRHVDGADAGWDEYYDANGLAYHVYSRRTPYGGHLPGDLNQIVYGPSDDDLKKFHMIRKKGLFEVEQ